MTTRAERIERNQDRNEARAERAQGRADDALARSSALVEHIPFGQPILVGHHSEGGHRSALRKSHAALGRFVEEKSKASRYRTAAASADRTGISIEDSDAQELLGKKIAGLEADQVQMKAINRIVRSKPKNELIDVKLAKIVELGFTEATARKIFSPDFAGRVGIPSYMLTNNNANIKRLKGRQIEIDRLASVQDGQILASGTCEGQAFEFVTDTSDNRIRFEAPRLSREASKELKRNGFKWSRNRGCWVRLLNENAMSAVRHWLAPALEKL